MPMKTGFPSNIPFKCHNSSNNLTDGAIIVGSVDPLYGLHYVAFKYLLCTLNLEVTLTRSNVRCQSSNQLLNYNYNYN